MWSVLGLCRYSSLRRSLFEIDFVAGNLNSQTSEDGLNGLQTGFMTALQRQKRQLSMKTGSCQHVQTFHIFPPIIDASVHCVRCVKNEDV